MFRCIGFLLVVLSLGVATPSWAKKGYARQPAFVTSPQPLQLGGPLPVLRLRTPAKVRRFMAQLDRQVRALPHEVRSALIRLGEQRGPLTAETKTRAKAALKSMAGTSVHTLLCGASLFCAYQAAKTGHPQLAAFLGGFGGGGVVRVAVFPGFGQLWAGDVRGVLGSLLLTGASTAAGVVGVSEGWDPTLLSVIWGFSIANISGLIADRT